jgi:hypothetical protein
MEEGVIAAREEGSNKLAEIIKSLGLAEPRRRQRRGGGEREASRIKATS